MGGVPPNVNIPPPGLCLPGQSENMPAVGTGGGGTYFLGFPSMPSAWPGQVMMAGQYMYHPSDLMVYPTSPMVSRQSSPSQSQSPSRSNSPTGRKNNSAMPRTSAPTTQSTVNVATTSMSLSNSQTNISNSNASGHQSPMTSANRSSGANSTQCSTQPPLRPTATISQSNASNSKQPPPPRLNKVPNSGESARDSAHNKDVSNVKGNLQNYSYSEVSTSQQSIVN